MFRVAKDSSMHTETQKTTLMSMVYPPGSHANASPLHVVACNDTCSFTWTGAEHINQVKSWEYWYTYLHGSSGRMNLPVLWWMDERTDVTQRKKELTNAHTHRLSLVMILI